MGGGLMQLVAYGAQDVYLTGNPQITFWKVTYRRHTNFAMESIEQTFNGQADFGRRVQCTISRNGDLAYRTYLQVTLPEVDARNGNTKTSSGETYTAGDFSQENGGIVAPRWLDYPGEHLISMVEVEIGGQRIDKQYGDWMHIWNQLTLTAEAKRGYDQMVGHTTQLTYLANAFGDDPDRPCGSCNTSQTCEIRNSLPETTLYVPLQFWFCRNPGMALPLIALQYHEVKINLELRPIDECLWAVFADPSGTAPQAGMPHPKAGTGGNADNKVANAYKRTLVAASLYVDYIFLDTEERRRMAQNPHEYLIEQVQFTGDESIGSSANKIKLNFNHPVKELVWVVQPDCHVDYCSSTYGCEQSGGGCEGCGCEGPLYAAHGAQPFNYTDAADVLPNSVFNYVPLQAPSVDGVTSAYAGTGNNHGFIGEPDSLYCDEILNSAYSFSEPTTTVVEADTGGVVDGVFGVHDARAVGCDVPNTYRGGTVSTSLGVVAAQVALDRHCWGQNPVVTAKLQLNGQDRFSEREGTYFDLVQPYQHHTRNPDTGINVYSFALRPEEHQPSGTANFSRIDNATLQLVVSANTVTGSKTAKVRVYAVNYNVLRVMSGMGGLAYSN